MIRDHRDTAKARSRRDAVKREEEKSARELVTYPHIVLLLLLLLLLILCGLRCMFYFKGAFSHTHLGSQFIRKNFFFVEKRELQFFRRFSSFVVSSSARRLSAFDERQRRRRALRGCVLRFALAFRVEEEERFFFVSSFGAFREREREKRVGSI